MNFIGDEDVVLTSGKYRGMEGTVSRIYPTDYIIVRLKTGTLITVKYDEVIEIEAPSN